MRYVTKALRFLVISHHSAILGETRRFIADGWYSLRIEYDIIVHVMEVRRQKIVIEVIKAPGW
jgi:hypothetical protein